MWFFYSNFPHRRSNSSVLEFGVKINAIRFQDSQIDLHGYKILKVNTKRWKIKKKDF